MQLSGIVRPIDGRQRERVVTLTTDYLQRAADLYRLRVESIPIRFDLKGRAAGMYRVQYGQRSIRYNPYLFAKYFDDNLANTVPHEVAHYVTDILYGLRNIRAHGMEWKKVMQSLGANPSATGRYDLAGIPVRRQQRFVYHCDCSSHRLSACRHNRVLRGKADYLCRRCGVPIRYSGRDVKQSADPMQILFESE